MRGDNTTVKSERIDGLNELRDQAISFWHFRTGFKGNILPLQDPLRKGFFFEACRGARRNQSRGTPSRHSRDPQGADDVWRRPMMAKRSDGLMVTRSEAVSTAYRRRHLAVALALCCVQDKRAAQRGQRPCSHTITGVQYASRKVPGSFRQHLRVSRERLPDSMTVISIQSQVAYGHVGNSAAVFPMQMNGIDVIAVPTTLLSNRPGYPTIRGRVLEADLVADLLAGIEERGAVDSCQIILSGYLGSPEIAEVVAEFITRAKKANPRLIYCCDPVLGDSDLGLFVQAGIPPIFRDVLCPLADVMTPNHFEFEWLCGARTTTIDELIGNAHSLFARGPSAVVVTSVELVDMPRDRIDTIALDRSSAWRLSTPKLPIRPSGTGDLFTSLLVSSLVRGAALSAALAEAVSATFAVLEHTAVVGAEEMRIIEAASLLRHPHHRFEATRIHT